MGGAPARRNKTGGTIPRDCSLLGSSAKREADLAQDREEPGTGPGIPDDALAPGEELPEPPTDEQVSRAADALKAPIRTQSDTLPLEGE